MIIGIGLCMIASLDTVALTTHQRDKVPKNDECSLSDVAFMPTGGILVYATDADFAFAGSIVTNKFTGPVKAYEIGCGYISESALIIPRFDTGEFASWDYKSPHVDRSWIWKYSHFHSC